MAKKRVFRAPLRSEWAAALLAGCELGEARQRYKAALNEARLLLESHPLAGVVAEAAARELGKRGALELVIDDTGDVMLQVHYGLTRLPKVVDKSKKIKLPSISELRAEAEHLGLDVSGLGKAKRKILARIKAHKAGAPPDLPPKPKMIKTAPALSPPRVLTLSAVSNEMSQVKPIDLETVALAGARLDMDALFGDDAED